MCKKAPACFAKSSGHVFNHPRREIELKESVLGLDWTWKLLIASLATTVDNTIKMADTVRKHGCQWCIRSIDSARRDWSSARRDWRLFFQTFQPSFVISWPISTNEPSLESLKSQQGDGAIFVPVSPRERTIARFLRRVLTLSAQFPRIRTCSGQINLYRGEIAVIKTKQFKPIGLQATREWERKQNSKQSGWERKQKRTGSFRAGQARAGSRRQGNQRKFRKRNTARGKRGRKRKINIEEETAGKPNELRA